MPAGAAGAGRDVPSPLCFFGGYIAPQGGKVLPRSRSGIPDRNNKKQGAECASAYLQRAVYRDILKRKGARLSRRTRGTNGRAEKYERVKGENRRRHERRDSRKIYSCRDSVCSAHSRRVGFNDTRSRHDRHPRVCRLRRRLRGRGALCRDSGLYRTGFTLHP